MNIRHKPLEMTTQREHGFYTYLLNVDKDLIFHLDVVKVRQLCNAYLSVQDVIREQLKFWEGMARAVGEDDFVEIKVGHIMRNLLNLKSVFDNEIPEEVTHELG